MVRDAHQNVRGEAVEMNRGTPTEKATAGQIEWTIFARLTKEHSSRLPEQQVLTNEQRSQQNKTGYLHPFLLV